MKIWATLLLCCNVFSLIAQTSDLELESFKKKYPNNVLVVIKNTEEVTIDVVNKDSLAITVKHYEEQIYISKLISSYGGESSVTYSSFNSIKNIEAYMAKVVDGKIQKTKVKSFYTKDVLDDNIFYDHQKEISFTYPSLEDGSKTYLKYDEVVKDPHFLGSFFFSMYSPSVFSELIVKCNEAVEIDFKLFNTDSLAIEHILSKEKKYNVQKWTYQGGKEYKNESNDLGSRYILPHIIYYIKNYTYKGDQVKVYSDIDQLYKWYYSFLEKRAPLDVAILKPIVDSLVANKTIELDKVKAIYYWVQDNIKYIAFEDGFNGFIPHSASYVCSNRYGDCKGMANLLVDMLGIANIKAYHAWIGSRDIPYRYKDVPTVYVDNHMITAYVTKEKTFFLDATSKQLSIEYPSFFIQGKEALIGIDKDHYEINEVPVVDASRNAIIDSSFISVDNELLKGKGVVHLSGYFKFDLMSFIQNSSAEDVRKYLEWFLQKGNNKFSLKNYEIYNQLNREKDLIIKYEYEVRDYIIVNQNEYYINMHLSNFNDFKIEKERQNTCSNKYQLHYKFVTILNLDNTFKVEQLPQNNSFKGETYSTEGLYSLQNNSVMLVQEHYSKHLVTNPSGFEKWNQMIKLFKKASNESISLRKK